MGDLRLVGLLGASGLLCAACVDDEHFASTESAIDITDFVLPALSAEDRTQIIRQYDALDPDNLVPRGLLEDAIIYFHLNRAHIPKTGTFTVIDLSRYSGLDRFWLVDLADGSVEPHKTSHGDGSDPDNNGYATQFSNTSGSHMSSLGFYLTGEIYDGTHPHSMRLDGLSPDGSPNGMANTNARSRAIVVHEAWYVNDDDDTQQGRSNGCPALDKAIEADVVDRIHGGSLMYIATSALAAPVGRATCGDAVCDGLETELSCAADCAVAEPPIDEPPPDDTGGCSATSSSRSRTWLLFVLLGLVSVFRAGSGGTRGRGRSKRSSST